MIPSQKSMKMPVLPAEQVGFLNSFFFFFKFKSVISSILSFCYFNALNGFVPLS